MQLNIKQIKQLINILMFSVYLGLISGGTALAAGDKQKSRLEIALAATPKATWIVQGQGRRELYVFFDPNCGYCPMLYKNLQPLIAPYNYNYGGFP